MIRTRKMIGSLMVAFTMSFAAPVAASDVAGAAGALEFKADFTAEPSLAMLQNGAVSADPFAQGQWIWSAYAGAALGDEAGEIYLGQFGIGYHVLDNLSFNLEAVVAVADGDPNEVNKGAPTRDAYGGGFNVILRWHFLRRDRFTLYMDVGCGIVAFDEEFPGHGTNLNFTPQTGLGFTYKLNENNLMLMAGARWFHLSNARHHGVVNNPGYDAGMLYAGVMWPF